MAEQGAGKPEDDFVPGTRLRRDPVIEAYKKDVDLTLLRENLRLTPTERLRKFDAFMKGLVKLRGAGRDRES